MSNNEKAKLGSVLTETQVDTIYRFIKDGIDSNRDDEWTKGLFKLIREEMHKGVEYAKRNCGNKELDCGKGNKLHK